MQKQPVDMPSTLHTKEAGASREQAKADIMIPDPAPEKAVAVLASPPHKETTDDTKETNRSRRTGASCE